MAMRPMIDDEEELGAPADFGGQVLPNPTGLEPMLDTEAPKTERLSGGAVPVLASKETLHPGQGKPAPAALEEVPAPEVPMAPGKTDLASAAAPAMPQKGFSGKEAFHSQMKDFEDRLRVNRGATASLDVHDPDYVKKLLALEMQAGGLRHDSASYEREHPWGTMESAHPGVGGKIGHALGVIGNVVGNATLGEENMSQIPSSQAAKEKQATEGSQEEAGALKGLEQNAKAGQEEAAVSKAPSEIGRNEAETNRLNNPAPTEAGMDKDVLDAGTRIASGQGTPNDLALVKSFHDLQTLKQKATAERPDNPEQQFIDDYMSRNKGSTVQDAIAAYAKLTHPENKSTADTRSDKSYQYNQNRLDKVRKPIDDTVARFSRLQETLNQHSPQADALVAPELLTVMAGGQGSGLRMNEAEIARIVGGRSAWENLKAKIQHWSLNPDEARSITADQDRQIRALVDAVGKKLSMKQSILESAQRNLLASDDPKEHRQIMADAQRQLDTMDAGAGGKDNVPTARPAGATHTGRSKVDHKLYFLDAQGNKLGPAE